MIFRFFCSCFFKEVTTARVVLWSWFGGRFDSGLRGLESLVGRRLCGGILENVDKKGLETIVPKIFVVPD